MTTSFLIHESSSLQYSLNYGEYTKMTQKNPKSCINVELLNFYSNVTKCEVCQIEGLAMWLLYYDIHGQF